MVLLFSVVLPLAVPVYFWGETWSNAWHVAVILRYAFLVNMESLVNSVAHYSGKRPYDRSILPAENLAVAFLTLGEGWHNYHHTFPWDYKTGAPGSYFANPTAGFIDFFSTIGWAYDMKTAPPTLVQERMQRTGTNVQKNSHVRDVWGWNDKDMLKEDKEDALIFRKQALN